MTDDQGAMPESVPLAPADDEPTLVDNRRNTDIVDPRDPSRLPIAVLSLTLLLLGVIGWRSGSTPVKGAGIVLFVLIGFGSAWTIALRRPRWRALAFSAPLGLTLVLLVGFVLVEVGAWSAGVPLFVSLVVLAACLNIWEVARSIAAFVASRGGNEPRRKRNLPSPRDVAGPASSAMPLEDVPSRTRIRRVPRLVAVCLGFSVAGLALCIWGAWRIKDYVPHGPGATLAALPPAWYLGIALVIAGVVVGLVASGWVAGVAVVTLQAAVTLTPAIVYSLPRYSWTFKHLGVVAYVLHHGGVSPNLDISQAWPALFAGVAWVCHSVGISSATVIARWWPPVIDVAVVLVMQRLAFRVLGSVRRSWLAAAIVVVGNTIGQDYFSPQSAGFLLAVAVFAAVYRRRDERAGIGARDWLAVAGMLIAVAVTHQLSPYMIVAATVVLAVFGLCRSRMVPVVALVSAGGWAVLNLHIVRRYFTFRQFGDLATNALTKGFVAPGIHKSQLIHYDSYAIALDAALIGVLAVLVLLQRRSKVHLALALCAASGAGLFLANSYGNEGAFRVVMFALPWLGILASDWNAARAPRLYWLPVTSLPLLLGTYLFANWGLDFMNVVRPADLQIEQAFEASAPAGSRLYILGSYLPVKSTDRYSAFKFRSYSDIRSGYPPTPSSSRRHGGSTSSARESVFSPSGSFAAFMRDAIPAKSSGLRKRHYYVAAGSAPEAASQELNLTTASQYRSLESQFARSRDWRLVSHSGRSYLFELVSLFYNSTRPTISGVVQDGQQLALNRGTWQSLNPLHFSYQWELCSVTGTGCVPIPGATHERIHLRAADVGHRLSVEIRATDSKGRTRQLTANTYPIGKPFPPANVVAPTIGGLVSKGSILTAHVGKWQSPDPLHYSYQWETCSSATSGCTPLPGRAKAHLRMRYSFVGHYISVVVSATDSEGQTTQVTTTRVGPVAP